MKKDNDILVNIIVRKRATSYLLLKSEKHKKTDFPVLTCVASVIGNEARTVIGARPARAMIVEDKKQILKNFRNMTKKQKEEAIEAFAEYAAENVPTAGNMRGSKEYRTLLSKSTGQEGGHWKQ